MILIFWTAASFEEAKTLVHALLNKRLIGCANILSDITSLYLWEGAIEESKEVKVFLKTTKERYEAVHDFILRESSYDTPEITAISPSQVSSKYFSWLKSVVL